jgi:hypothetical protein
MNFDNVGISTVKDSTAFKKIQFFSKINHTSLFNSNSDYTGTYSKLTSLYNNDLNLNYSSNYGMDRQHTYTSLSSTLPLFSTLVDKSSLDKFYNYNYNNSTTDCSSNTTINRATFNTFSDFNAINLESKLYTYMNLLPNYFSRLNNIDFHNFIKIPNLINFIGYENDSKQYDNPLKYTLNYKHKRKML